MELLDELAQVTLGRGAAERLSYAAAFKRCVGIDPHRCSISQLADTAIRRGLSPSSSWDRNDRDAWLDWLLVSHVEPTLGIDRPTILYDYPASQSALAQVRPSAVPVAERFELYVDGIELANGYHELTDPDVLERRAETANEGARGGWQIPPALTRAGCWRPCGTVCPTVPVSRWDSIGWCWWRPAPVR